MTAPTNVRPPPPGSPPPGSPPPSSPAVTPRRPNTREVVGGAIRQSLAGTPGTMRLLGAISIVACLLFGVLAFTGAANRAHALGQVRSDAAQLVRVQTIRTNLVSADANLTNAFLVGGLEPAAAREAYSYGISTATSTLAEAAGANSADAVSLQKVNDVVSTYTGLVEAARANNRQGFPIGAAYLRQATKLLRDDALPVLERLVQTEEGRVASSYSSSAKAVIVYVVGLLLALVALLVTLGWLAVHTRRWINVPIGVAAVIVLLVGLIGLGVMTGSQGKADSARTGAYRATVALATARIDAFDAKSAESLTLIARGSGQAYEDRFHLLAGNVTNILGARDLSGDASESFAAYLSVHQQIRKLDDSGQHDAAVALATSTATGANSNTDFNNFDGASRTALDARVTSLRNDLGSARTPLLALSWIVLLAGVVAALASWRGITARLREYR